MLNVQYLTKKPRALKIVGAFDQFPIFGSRDPYFLFETKVFI